VLLEVLPKPKPVLDFLHIALLCRFHLISLTLWALKHRSDLVDIWHLNLSQFTVFVVWCHTKTPLSKTLVEMNANGLGEWLKWYCACLASVRP
jgi:hypothetical protein